MWLKNYISNREKVKISYQIRIIQPYFNKKDELKLQDMPYNTTWKDGKLVNIKKNDKTPDPVRKNNHYVEDGHGVRYVDYW